MSSILILGGTGTVGSRIARQLPALSANTTVLVASRNDNANNTNGNSNGNGNSTPIPPPPPSPTAKLHQVTFDWHDSDTWDNPFSFSTETEIPSITAVYLIAPPSLDADSLMTLFVEFAHGRGVRRFVLQSASSIEAGGPAMGKVHAYLRERGQRGEVEWAVLRPTWFQENFADQPVHLRGIREESKIYSATGEGKIPWVSADDIAAVAARVLTGVEPLNTEYLVLGPELLSYGEIATILSQVLGRRIVHVDLSAADLEKRHRDFGMPDDYARMMSAMDTAIKFGAENRTNDGILAITGSKPRRFRDFAESVKDVWEAGRGR